MNGKKAVIAQVALLILLAFISAVTPPPYLPLVFLLYFVIIMTLTTVSARRLIKATDKPRGLALFEEKDASHAIAGDPELVVELKQQLKAVMIAMLLPLVLLIVVIPLYWQYINPPLSSALSDYVGNTIISKFITYLILYSFLSVLALALRKASSKIARLDKQLLIPRRYSVYRNGLVVDGRFMSLGEDLCYEVDARRRFMNIRSKKMPYIVRLYTLEISKLKEAFKEVRISECK